MGRRTLSRSPRSWLSPADTGELPPVRQQRQRRAFGRHRVLDVELFPIGRRLEIDASRIRGHGANSACRDSCLRRPCQRSVVTNWDGHDGAARVRIEQFSRVGPPAWIPAGRRRDANRRAGAGERSKKNTVANAIRHAPTVLGRRARPRNTAPRMTRFADQATNGEGTRSRGRRSSLATRVSQSSREALATVAAPNAINSVPSSRHSDDLDTLCRSFAFKVSPSPSTAMVPAPTRIYKTHSACAVPS